jgi:hypothetical protein
VLTACCKEDHRAQALVEIQRIGPPPRRHVPRTEDSSDIHLSQFD